MPEWQASVTRAISAIASCQSAIPPAEAQTINTAVSSGKPPRKTSTVSQSSTNINNLINPPDVEQGDGALGLSETSPGDEFPPSPTQAHASLTSESMGIDSRPGAGQMFRAASARRGAGQELGIRGDPIRYNPSVMLSPPLTASSTVWPRQRQASRSRVVTTGAPPTFPGTPQKVDNTQYDPQFSEISGATVGYIS
ncbi:unnamed protein product [Rhizoctonia solani]|uniref:Uncharacterized protein n=1 Tax=Rhizoctonia solani TaxID=456999 RepID=A0A8H3H600_9AGAM|nr:unnamed protein product [Rhizoctonia solani]